LSSQPMWIFVFYTTNVPNIAIVLGYEDIKNKQRHAE